MVLIGCRGDTHAFLVRSVVSILNKSDIIRPLLLNFFKTASLFIELTLKQIAHFLHLSDFVSLITDQYLELFPLDIDIGSLLLGLLFLRSTHLQHADKIFEISRGQLFRTIIINPAFVITIKFFKFSALLDSIVVLCDHLRCAFAPLRRVEIV